MVWASITDGEQSDTKETASMETIPSLGSRGRERPRTKWSDVIHRDLINLGFGWSIEEAEVAAQDHIVWRILTNQAASADVHDAGW